MYGRPPGGTDETAWTKAVRENPESDKYVLIILSLSLAFPVFIVFVKTIRAQTGKDRRGVRR
jgi:hypothetical protein